MNLSFSWSNQAPRPLACGLSVKQCSRYRRRDCPVTECERCSVSACRVLNCATSCCHRYLDHMLAPSCHTNPARSLLFCSLPPRGQRESGPMKSSPAHQPCQIAMPHSKWTAKSRTFLPRPYAHAPELETVLIGSKEHQCAQERPCWSFVQALLK